DLWLQVLPNDDRDLDVLSRDFRPKVAAEDVLGYEVEIEKHPDDVGLQDDAALLYLELGRTEPAIAHFTRSLALTPSAQAHYNLGTAYAMAHRLAEAESSFRDALSLDPAYAKAHNNLGNVLLALGRNEQAIQEFREAVRLQPDSEAAKKNLAAALQRVK